MQERARDKKESSRFRLIICSRCRYRYALLLNEAPPNTACPSCCEKPAETGIGSRLRRQMEDES